MQLQKYFTIQTPELCYNIVVTVTELCAFGGLSCNNCITIRGMENVKII
jgi:hypothetical protein